MGTSKQMENTVKQIYESSSLRNNNKYWTVFSHSRKPLEHPFAPPPPFCDGLNTLRPNKFLRVSRRLATLEPSLIPNRTKNKKDYDNSHTTNNDSIFSNCTNLYDLPYLKAFS